MRHAYLLLASYRIVNFVNYSGPRKLSRRL